MLNENQLAVIHAVQCVAEGQPITKRIQLYHGLADFIGPREGQLRKSFLDRASILEEVQSRCAQFNLKIGC